MSSLRKIPLAASALWEKRKYSLPTGKSLATFFPPSPSDRATENSLESEKPQNLAWPEHLRGKIKAKKKKGIKKWETGQRGWGRAHLSEHALFCGDSSLSSLSFFLVLPRAASRALRWQLWHRWGWVWCLGAGGAWAGGWMELVLVLAPHTLCTPRVRVSDLPSTLCSFEG